jgi:preprotein translocase subunit SecA
VSSSVLRPGISAGAYPEREDAEEGRLENLVRRAVGALGRRRHGDPRGFEAFARSVAEANTNLPDASDAQLLQRAGEARERLLREGLSDPELTRVFALVREAARRTLGMPHYDVQLVGGWVMARGMLAEMETGEGKTLTATLPATAAALAGIPVHVVSVNDYLVQRDADAMRPVYRALGLSVGTVTQADRDPQARRAAYACDVTYVTSQQLAFDYLRDGLVRGRRRDPLSHQLESLHEGPSLSNRLMLRGLCFALVDEADSVLIDEARTPLILSGPGGSPEEEESYQRALRLARDLEEGADFAIDRRAGAIQLSQRGRDRLEELARPFGGFWTGPRRREEWATRALSALHLFSRDRHYLVREDKVEIIDQPTGRVMPDRAWERGLHQLIEAKEGCPLTSQRETVARISYQRFFRRYLRLAGMTGTAREVARELWSVYGLNTVAIPPRLPSRRKELPMQLFRTDALRWSALVGQVHELHRAGRPVLVGTCSVASSEHLSRLLREQGLAHRVLNAQQDAEEAVVVAAAGAAGRITVATNMAGRGTDIALGPGVVETGGLHVIATRRAEARRIDRQLLGRCGRQGDPGTCQALLSLEDEPLQLYYPAPVLRLIDWLSRIDFPAGARLAELLTWLPQRAEEGRHARMRKSLIALEDYLRDLLAFSGGAQ